MDVVVWTRYPDQRHAQCRSMHFRMPAELELSIGDLPGSIRTVCVSGGFVVSLLLYKYLHICLSSILCITRCFRLVATLLY